MLCISLNSLTLFVEGQSWGTGRAGLRGLGALNKNSVRANQSGQVFFCQSHFLTLKCCFWGGPKPITGP